ncbi:MAG: hypothetical protein R3F31_06145 [Verrucomicrobiales bacterium]
MSKVNNNTAENRFRAIVAGFVAFASFGIATWLMLVITGNRDESIPDAVIDKRAELRADNFATLSGEQASLVAPDKVAVAMKSVVGSLAAKPLRPPPRRFREHLPLPPLPPPPLQPRLPPPLQPRLPPPLQPRLPPPLQPRLPPPLQPRLPPPLQPRPPSSNFPFTSHPSRTQTNEFDLARSQPSRHAGARRH